MDETSSDGRRRPRVNLLSEKERIENLLETRCGTAEQVQIENSFLSRSALQWRHYRDRLSKRLRLMFLIMTPAEGPLRTGRSRVLGLSCDASFVK